MAIRAWRTCGARRARGVTARRRCVVRCRVRWHCSQLRWARLRLRGGGDGRLHAWILSYISYFVVYQRTRVYRVRFWIFCETHTRINTIPSEQFFLHLSSVLHVRPLMIEVRLPREQSFCFGIKSICCLLPMIRYAIVSNYVLRVSFIVTQSQSNLLYVLYFLRGATATVPGYLYARPWDSPTRI